MQIHKNDQGQGIVFKMLKKFKGMTRDETCYLVGYLHLSKFYKQIGFVEVFVSNVPIEIWNCHQNAQNRFPTSKFNIIMKRT